MDDEDDEQLNVLLLRQILDTLMSHAACQRMIL